MTATPRRVALWEAVNEYARACGGDTGIKTTSDWRMEAVVKVERAADCDTFDELVAALQAAPLPSSMGSVESHYQRFYDWYEKDCKPVLKKAEEQRT